MTHFEDNARTVYSMFLYTFLWQFKDCGKNWFEVLPLNTACQDLVVQVKITVIVRDKNKYIKMNRHTIAGF